MDEPAPDRVAVELVVNGQPRSAVVPARMTLADLLRDELRLVGTKLGCEQGVCGSCTVMLDGRSVRSCLLLAAQVAGGEVTTVEGLSGSTALSPLQEAFARYDAVQCGFCTSGMLMTAAELVCLPALDDPTVRDLLCGNLCRCTGYQGAVDAILDVHAAQRAPARTPDLPQSEPATGDEPGAPPPPRAPGGPNGS